jgi:hypothetical protein
MEKYIPDIYQKSIYTINYDALYNRGIRCLFIDLDNTIAPITIKSPHKKTKELFNNLKSMGFKIIIFSNSRRSRIKPFKEELDVDFCAHASKPFKRKYLKILSEYNLDVNSVACIGDQLLTDIQGGNKMSITTILVNPIGTKELLGTKINRIFEKRIFKKLRENDLFKKGKYYE